MSIAVEFDRVSIVFGNDPDRALPLMDRGLTRTEIQEQTGLPFAACPNFMAIYFFHVMHIAAHTFRSHHRTAVAK